MLKVTWRGVVEHPVRFLMSVIAVVLGIAFVTGTFALRGVLATTFHDIVDSSMAADVYVRGEPLGDADAGELDAATGQSSNRAQVAASLAETIDEVSGVRVALPAYTGSVVLVGADGTAVTTSGAPSFGVDASADDPTLSLLEGRWPQSSSEIALEHSALVHSGLSVGDTTTIVAAGQIMDVTVVGDLGFDAAVSGAIIVGLDSDTAAALFAPDGTVDSIAVFGDGSQDEEALAGRVSSALSGSEVSVVTGDEARAESRAAVDQIVGFIGTFLMIFAVIALFVGGFIITNTFTMAVRQRLREIAVLRAVGASPRQVFASVVGQAAIVGLVGSALGILGGAGLIEIVKKLFASMGMELASSIPITRSTVAVALVTGLLVSVLAAAIPARRAAKVPPVDAMNESIGGKEKPLRTRTVIGAALLVAGAACLIGATRADGGVANWSLGVGAAGLLIGALVVAPAVMPVASRVLSWPFVVIGRPVV
ncbi:MAG: FtsX-like permease family protein, partial [Cellulomonadaceae bacterium]